MHALFGHAHAYDSILDPFDTQGWKKLPYSFDALHDSWAWVTSFFSFRPNKKHLQHSRPCFIRHIQQKILARHLNDIIDHVIYLFCSWIVRLCIILFIKWIIGCNISNIIYVTCSKLFLYICDCFFLFIILLWFFMEFPKPYKLEYWLFWRLLFCFVTFLSSKFQVGGVGV